MGEGRSSSDGLEHYEKVEGDNLRWRQSNKPADDPMNCQRHAGLAVGRFPAREKAGLGRLFVRHHAWALRGDHYATREGLQGTPRLPQGVWKRDMAVRALRVLERSSTPRREGGTAALIACAGSSQP